MRLCTVHSYWVGIFVLLMPLLSISQSSETKTKCESCSANGLLKEPDISNDSGSRLGRPDAPSSTVPVARGMTQQTKTVPQSLFDAAQNRFKTVEVDVEVKTDANELESSAPLPFQVGGEEIISTAGSYGDLMRYLQVLPGVVPTSDASNEVLVRGGHPIENLYLVEGFEIPNINHMARLGSTGGFAPMIDSAVVQSLSLRTGGYDASFSDRLSSVTEISLLDSRGHEGHVEGDFGIQGIGGLAELKVHQSDLLVSGHHGLLDVVTQNAGLNGVPSYTNGLTRFHLARPSGDTITALTLAGLDSIDITPCQADQDESSSINSQYSGWRETTGLSWQKILSDRSFGVLSVTDSAQLQHIHQQDQYVDPSKAIGVYDRACPLPRNYVKTTPVYMEDTNNAVSSLSYRYEWASPILTVSSGTTGWLQRPDFRIAQPVGIYSPYSATPVRADGTSFSRDFSTGETGSFINLYYRGIKNLGIGFGSRFQTIAFGSHTTFTFRTNARYGLGERVALNAAFATYAQMPPYIYLVSFDQNRILSPMRVSHRIIGIDLALPGSRIHVEGYDKPYTDTPASSEYPTLTLHNIPDQLGDEIVWLPMNSLGRGRSSGIELSDSMNIGSRVILKGSLAYARAKFAGADGIFRPSDFDFPWMSNLLSNWRIGRGYGASARFGYASGRPYTPYDMPESLAQNRPIYDLQRVNRLRAPYYSRLDAQINKDILVRGVHLEIYAGVDNITNRQNFLTYAWLPINDLGNTHRYPVKQLNQMPIFPNFGVRFILR